MTCLACVRRSAVATLVAVSFGVLGGCNSSNKNCCDNGEMKHAAPATQPTRSTPQARAPIAPVAPAAAVAPVAPVEPVAPVAPAAPARPAAATFGAAGKLPDDQAITVPQLMSNVDRYKGQYVRVTGTVDKVCTRKGCWLTLKGDGADPGAPGLFVKFPDPAEGRLIPMEAVGKPAAVEGTVKVKEIPPEVAKHYAEESGATPEQLAKIVGPQKQITLASPSAQVVGVENPQATK